MVKGVILIARSHGKQREWKVLSSIMKIAEGSIDNQQQQLRCRNDLAYKDLTPYNAIERLPHKKSIVY